MPDVLVMGGGVIGLSTALELASHGLRVQVLDQGQLGQEASWAGAGMLPPGGLDGHSDLETQLRAASFRLWPKWESRLRELTGIDIGYRRCGALEVRPIADEHSLLNEEQRWQQEGVPIERLESSAFRARFPQVDMQAAVGFHVPDYAQVRNPRLLKALISACQSLGVELSPGIPVMGLNVAGSKIESIDTHQGRFTADTYVLAAGAWSSSLIRPLGMELNIKPMRGQIVLLEMHPLPFTCIVQCDRRYLVPRSDGRILVGATEEAVGFNRSNTAEAVADLVSFATRWVPALAAARFERCWAGLRPYRPGGLPILGRCPSVRNLILAAGHFRAGLQLSPITGQLVRELVLNQETTISPAILERTWDMHSPVASPPQSVCNAS